jgi:branched-chain amino acid transport system substrate-binding protein
MIFAEINKRFSVLAQVLFASVSLTILTVGAVPNAMAQTSVTRASDNEIVIGQVASLSGANGADLGLGLQTGINIYFQEINARGGIKGRKLRLISKDDQYKPDETVRLTEELIAKDAPLALIGYRGTANTLALVKSELLVKSGIPLIGTLSGAAEIQGAPMIFHARTSYRDEFTQLVAQLAVLGIDRIGVLYVDDAFGKSGLEAVKTALTERKQSPVAVAAYDKAADKVEASIKAAAATLAKATPQVVVMVAVGEPVHAFVKEMRLAGSSVGIYGISVVNPDLVVEKTGLNNAHGIVFSQVFPFPYDDSTAVVREYRSLLTKHAPAARPSYFSLEGFIYAKILVEGIRQSGANVTRKKLTQTLQNLSTLDLGDFKFKLNPATGNGSSFTELTMVGKTGKLIK